MIKKKNNNAIYMYINYGLFSVMWRRKEREFR